MDDVDPGGVADMAGIIKGDFLLEVTFFELHFHLTIFQSEIYSCFSLTHSSMRY